MSKTSDRYFGSTDRCDEILRELEQRSESDRRLRSMVTELKIAVQRETTDAGQVPTFWRGLVRLEDVVRDHVRGVYRSLNENKARAARVLGVNVKTVARILSRSHAIEE